MNESTKVGISYHSRDVDEQRVVYDQWAGNYEKDLFAMGNRIPTMCPVLFAQHVPTDIGSILDAGCGGGLQSEPLALMGYGPITGIDLSEGMLDVARSKGFYADLRRMTMGEPLAFDSESFDAIMCCGVLTPGHAPANSLFELIRVAKSGAPLVFSMRDDKGQGAEYFTALDELDASGAWDRKFVSQPFQSLPYGEPEVFHRVYLYYKS